MFKTFIPPQTDGIIRSSFGIGCSESKVIFKRRKNNKNNNKKRLKRLYRPLQGASVRISCISQTNTVNRKALDNNDLNQVWLTSGFVKTRVGWGCSVSQAHETWSRPFLFKDFPVNTAGQSTHGKARREPAIRDAHKLAQDVFPP